MLKASIQAIQTITWKHFIVQGGKPKSVGKLVDHMIKDALREGEARYGKDMLLGEVDSEKFNLGTVTLDLSEVPVNILELSKHNYDK
jgi:hypothetical protein